MMLGSDFRPGDVVTIDVDDEGEIRLERSQRPDPTDEVKEMLQEALA
jgi:antitoxin component of MazEF toxin-antitoxin module